MRFIEGIITGTRTMLRPLLLSLRLPSLALQGLTKVKAPGKRACPTTEGLLQPLSRRILAHLEFKQGFPLRQRSDNRESSHSLSSLVALVCCSPEPLENHCCSDVGQDKANK